MSHKYSPGEKVYSKAGGHRGEVGTIRDQLRMREGSLISEFKWYSVEFENGKTRHKRERSIERMSCSSCGSDLAYSDNEKTWFCPFCYEF